MLRYISGQRQMTPYQRSVVQRIILGVAFATFILVLFVPILVLPRDKIFGKREAPGASGERDSEAFDAGDYAVRSNLNRLLKLPPAVPTFH